MSAKRDLYVNFEGPSAAVPARAPGAGDKDGEGAGPLTWFT